MGYSPWPGIEPGPPALGATGPPGTPIPSSETFISNAFCASAPCWFLYLASVSSLVSFIGTSSYHLPIVSLFQSSALGLFLFPHFLS